MNTVAKFDPDIDGSLILAAEDCPPAEFEKLHRFSEFEERLIRGLMAHGPVLIRGGRGTGKSALMIEAERRLREGNLAVFPVYLSLRNLPLLRSKGEEYEKLFCDLLGSAISAALKTRGCEIAFIPGEGLGGFQKGLNNLAIALQQRIVLFFDDAAHLGRETSLAEFFDIFRTISSSYVSCKAAIYPGVTKFGIRFDVYNDATVLDVVRDENQAGFAQFFLSVMEARFQGLSERVSSRSVTPSLLARLLGRTVLGNMRAFVIACIRLKEEHRIGFPELTKALQSLASDYYWPLLEELEPKLGLYAPLIPPSKEIAEALFRHAAKARDQKGVTSVVVHRDLCQRYAKPLEILEYAGFISRREASKALKSGGRGPRYALNLANLLECASGSRLYNELVTDWLNTAFEPAEIHSSSGVINVELPELGESEELQVLSLPIDSLKRSLAYPYGLTPMIVESLTRAGVNTIGAAAAATNDELDAIPNIGEAKVRRIKDVVYQAIWM